MCSRRPSGASKKSTSQEAGKTEENLDPGAIYGIGGDAKVGIGPALNLDLTVNPDFSQVEVDEQVTDLDRFEIFFPEKRQFFLENSDLFSLYCKDRLSHVLRDFSFSVFVRHTFRSF